MTGQQLRWSEANRHFVMVLHCTSGDHGLLPATEAEFTGEDYVIIRREATMAGWRKTLTGWRCPGCKGAAAEE